ncbi:MAG: hypothetical protein LKJ86_08075 [Oscillibacter sp.]|jgi:rubrerythrin|nr:hypothetical protein [Oscillibacter sp.]
MAKRTLSCLRCGAEMKFLKRESIQLGEQSFFGGDWGNLLAGSLTADFYVCPACRKLEFYYGGELPQPREEEPTPWGDQEPQTGFYTPGVMEDVKCPRCGKLHPADDDFCPLCGLKREEPEET